MTLKWRHVIISLLENTLHGAPVSLIPTFSEAFLEIFFHEWLFSCIVMSALMSKSIQNFYLFFFFVGPGFELMHLTSRHLCHNAISPAPLPFIFILTLEEQGVIWCQVQWRGRWGHMVILFDRNCYKYFEWDQKIKAATVAQLKTLMKEDFKNHFRK